MRSIGPLSGLLSAVLIIVPVEAQQMVPPGAFFIGGESYECGPTVTVLYPWGNDIATAMPGVINLNWPMFSSMPRAVQSFIYAHECAHQLGANEPAADCWAVRIGRAQGFIEQADIEDICASVWMSPGDWTHFPGPARCEQMHACFAN